ncbi:MAG: class II glutamine amidotransferase [Nanopusillaceae archaeon]
MCGIVAIISEEFFDISEGLERLRRLEYRGYDSYGFCSDKTIFKKVGRIEKIDFKGKSKIFIGHTRWATHGKVSEINAHPHYDCNKEIFVVHNGTIDNYLELKNYLVERGHKFVSETDSEIFAHWFEEELKNGKEIKEIVLDIFKNFYGTYAVIIYLKNLNKIVAIKNGSPLVVGLDKNTIYLASDVYAFLDKVENIITMDDYEFLIINL